MQGVGLLLICSAKARCTIIIVCGAVMVWRAIASLWEFALFGVTLGAAGAVIVAILHGDLRLRSLWLDTRGNFSPGRLQLFVTTWLACVYYLGDVLISSDITKLPELPSWFTATMLGSNAIYLGGKSSGLPAVAQFVSSLLPR